MTHSGLAEMYRLLLLIGATDTREVIVWADSVIATADSPPRWILDISLSTDDGPDSIAEKLRDVVSEDERTVATYSAILRVFRRYRAGEIGPHKTARMLLRWADHARLTGEESFYSQSATHVADAVGDGFMSDHDFINALDHSIAYFAAKGEALGAKSS